MPSCFVY